MVSKSVILSITGCETYVDPTTGVNATLATTLICFADSAQGHLADINVGIIILPTDSSAVIRQKMIDAAINTGLSTYGLTLTNGDIILSSYTTGLSTAASETRTDTFTVAGVGVTVDTSLKPLSIFSITVKGVGGTPTSWDISLEGSLDGVTWTTILQDITATQIDKTVYSGSNRNPCLFMRSNCNSLVLGSATAIQATILGVS